MKAVILKNKGDVSQLSVEEVEKPNIKSDELLIKTEAFSINPIELKTRKGNAFSEKLLNDKPSILGWDGAGIVEKVGKDIDSFSLNDRVFGVIGFPEFGKTYAEYFVAKEKDLAKIPDNVGFEEAAVSTIAAQTAYQSLKYHAKLKPGKRILIHAASGGVGHFGVQIAKYFGAEVYATASAEKRDFVMSIGVDHFIDYKTESFENKVKDMDVVFDLIGGNYIDRSLNCLKKGGMLISIPSATNEAVEEKASQKGCKGVRFILEPSQKDTQAIADLLGSQKLMPFVSKRFTLDDIRLAHLELEKGHIKGKIAVTP